MALAIIFGCGPSAITRITTTSPVNGLLVQVRELDASRADVRNYSEPLQPYGLQTTEAIVEALQEAGSPLKLQKVICRCAARLLWKATLHTLIEGGDTTSGVLLGRLGPVGATRIG